jgi:PAS domain S-box-containing protein
VTDQSPEGPRIAVVDDEPLLAHAMVRRLTSCGYQARHVGGGPAALEELTVEDPACDLVLLDVMMPEVDGLAVLRAIRTRHSGSELPVIMVTGRAEPELIVEALGAGADDYVVKPPETEVLLARIQTQLARVEMIRALKASEERYALAARGSADGLWDWDLQAGRLFVSARWKELLGFDGAEELGDAPRMWLDRILPDDAGRVDRAITDHVMGGVEQLAVEHRLRRRDGTYGWVLVRGAAVRDERGRATRIAGSLTDTSRTPLHDSLTGLPNRHLLLERMDSAIRKARRDGDGGHALLLVHIDRLDLVAETQGLQRADELIRETAHRLGGCMRDYDTVLPGLAGGGPAATGDNALSRLGGSEFALFCERVDRPSDAIRIAERVQRALAPPVEVGGGEVLAGVSIGISMGDGSIDGETLMGRARSALRRSAERTSGLGIALFDARMQEEAAGRLKLEAELAGALATQGLFLEYQPIVDLSSGAIQGFEALVRWNHPDRGRLPPIDFVPLAEEIGLIHQLGWWVLRDACSQAAGWQGHSTACHVAVNVSPDQFVHPEWVPLVEQTLEQTGLTPDRLHLELTEGVLAREPETIAATLGSLRELGVRISLDDFGTGYSSFAYLRRFAIDTLKIDRSFVSGLPGNEDDAAIARSIVALADQMGMGVVAEGVETAAQAKVLLEMGCAHAQGWHFGRPGSAELALELLDR